MGSEDQKLQTKNQTKRNEQTQNTQMKTFNSNVVFCAGNWLSVFCFLPSADAATITVTKNRDSGPGSLRQALADAHDDSDRLRLVAQWADDHTY